jgi:hypothetical protein
MKSKGILILNGRVHHQTLQKQARKKVHNYSDSDEDESYWEEALNFRRNGCGRVFGDQTDVESTGDEQTRNSSSSVVTPRLGGGFKVCLFGMENELLYTQTIILLFF